MLNCATKRQYLITKKRAGIPTRRRWVSLGESFSFVSYGLFVTLTVYMYKKLLNTNVRQRGDPVGTRGSLNSKVTNKNTRIVL